MIRAVIFDCFGVLMVDTFELMIASVQEHDPALAMRIRAISEANDRGQLPPDEAAQETADLFGMTVEDYERKKNAGEMKHADVLDFAASLRPKFKTAMLSNVGTAGLQRRFVPGELEKYFDVVVASSDIGFAKPEPEAYEMTAARLGVRTDECVMIDDRENYCAGAEAVGMKAICFKSFTQLKRELEPLLSQSEK